jgi:hypothetical protein
VVDLQLLEPLPADPRRRDRRARATRSDVDPTVPDPSCRPARSSANRSAVAAKSSSSRRRGWWADASMSAVRTSRLGYIGVGSPVRAQAHSRPSASALEARWPSTCARLQPGQRLAPVRVSSPMRCAVARAGRSTPRPRQARHRVGAKVYPALLVRLAHHSSLTSVPLGPPSEEKAGRGNALDPPRPSHQRLPSLRGPSGRRAPFGGWGGS